ncbi:RNA polymerase sigma factor [Clostridium niameyense]|uniref:RNA polymerase sigma factor n=1 Tax=Clostridium niameyense TaxID=1622073 RepID=UPI000ADE8B0A|nr:sigma factor-like helix-turn-helix DNA-binding protein [Clostridium niameyense]
MLNEEKEEKFLEIEMVIEEELKKEKNNERRYYRHNISLEYLENLNVPVGIFCEKDSTSFNKEMEALFDFIDLISNEKLLQALKKLNESDFKLLELRYRYGFSLNEIAIKLQIKNTTARQRHIRVLAKLKSMIEKNI